MKNIPVEIVFHVDHFICEDYDSVNWLLACGLSMTEIFNHWQKNMEIWKGKHPRSAMHVERVFCDPEIYEMPGHYASTSDKIAINYRPISTAAVQMISLAAALRTQLSMVEYMYEGLAFADRKLPHLYQYEMRRKMLEIAKVMRFAQDRFGEVLIGYTDDDDE